MFEQWKNQSQFPSGCVLNKLSLADRDFLPLGLGSGEDWLQGETHL
uniref:Uncharacterized protein n=1 Tax=Anguilla anguilla TaxID=7936 RepID=A0A0E9UGE3_ANGAN